MIDELICRMPFEMPANSNCDVCSMHISLVQALYSKLVQVMYGDSKSTREIVSDICLFSKL